MSDREPAASPPADPVLLDNVVLSNFLLADASDVLLRALDGRGVVTPEILDENAAGRRAGHAALAELDSLLASRRPEGEALRGLTEVSLGDGERGTYVDLVGFLGRGEASCIAVALHRGGTFASDDRAARAAAESRGVPVTGTIGLLVSAARRSLTSPERADAILRRMIERGFRSPLRSLCGLL